MAAVHISDELATELLGTFDTDPRRHLWHVTEFFRRRPYKFKYESVSPKFVTEVKPSAEEDNYEVTVRAGLSLCTP